MNNFLDLGNGQFAYVPEKYEPIAIDIKPSKECEEYHRNSCVQINVGKKSYLKKLKS